jgi:hypothetical protein
MRWLILGAYVENDSNPTKAAFRSFGKGTPEQCITAFAGLAQRLQTAFPKHLNPTES